MIIYSNKIHLPDRIMQGHIIMENGRIIEINEGRPLDNYLDYSGYNIVPGFIDLHVHGFATGSFWYEGTESSLKRMSKSLALTGVTTFLGTTGTDSLATINSQLKEAKKAIDVWTPETGSQILGIHLEGPFINKEFKGMQKEEHCINPDNSIFDQFVSTVGKEDIYLVTLAPELPGAKELIEYIHDMGIQISIGHSAADIETIEELKAYGLGGVTHMYSGMRGFHHRRPGVVGAALYFDDLYCEFAKQTGKTVRKEAFEIAYRIKTSNRITLCTDCTGLAHVKEPFYHYIRKETYIPDGELVRVENVNGESYSINKKNYNQVKNLELSYIGSVQNIVKNHNVGFKDIIKMASENPAKYVNVFDRKGSIEMGKDADILIVDDQWNLYEVFVQGFSQIAKE